MKLNTEEGLVRAVGVPGLTAGMINYTIGAGIFVLPALVAARVGGAAPLIYIICAALMALLVMCFADAGSRVSLSGGTYAYAEVAFGPFVGFIVATSLWFGANVLASAAVANVLMDTLAEISPAFGGGAVRGTLMILMYGLFAAINIRGVKIGSRMVQSVTLAKLTPLLVLIAFGLLAVNSKNLVWPGMPTSGEIARTTVILLFAFIGIESALTPSGEVRDPAKTVPRAVFSALVIVTLVYMALQFVAQGVLGPALATNTAAPLAATARSILGEGGQTLILVGTAISTFGYVAGDMLASPRGIYALGRDRLLPPVIGLVNDRFKTPHVAILVHAVLCAVFAVSGSFEALLVLAALATLIVYLICCAATIRLQRMNVRDEGTVPFRMPGGPVVPVVAIVVVVWLMASSTRQEFVAMGAMLVVETVLYLLMRARRVASPAT
ncbi:MAG: APC family permease [Gemmatimonadales bacterium]|nr:APC family permease [Gemmatimonadales bacterium]